MNKDALGGTIIIGNKYGYTTDSNGITTTSYGTALRETPTGLITIDIEYQVRAYGVGGNRTESLPQHMGKSSVKPIKLFPVNIA